MDAFYQCTKCLERIDLDTVICTTCAKEVRRIKYVTLDGCERWDETRNRFTHHSELAMADPAMMARCMTPMAVDVGYSLGWRVYRRRYAFSHIEYDARGPYYIYQETWQDPEQLIEMAKALKAGKP